MTPEISPPRQPPTAGPQGRQPTRPGTGTAFALLAAVLVTAPACLLAIYATPHSQRALVAWGTASVAVLLCVAASTTTRAVLVSRHLRAVMAVRDGQLEVQQASFARFADVTVPDVIERLRGGASAETAVSAAPPPEDEAQQRVLMALAAEVRRSESLRAAAMSACANAAGRVQALATSMAADLREMEHKHADENVLGDLLHLDHRTAQAGRLADCIAVLTGARSGRRWAKPIVMESILRGAMGRISGYQRIRLHSTSTAAVAGHAAEGVMHALAELMDNAANFSPPNSEVHVYVEEVSAGIVITVEDGGLVMGEVALRRAQQAVSGEPQDLTALSGTRLGLAVVGRLARKHELSVSFRPSAHGGTGVLVMIPQELVTQSKREDRSVPPTQQRPAPEPGPASGGGGGARTESGAAASVDPLPSRERKTRVTSLPEQRSSGPEPPRRSVPEPHPEHAASEDSGEPAGLPKRRRGQTLAAANRRSARQRSSDTPEPARTPQQSGSRFGAFRRAVQGDNQKSREQSRERAFDQASKDDTAGEDNSPAATPSHPPLSSSRSEDHTE